MLLAYAKIPIPENRLHARQATLFIAAAERAASAFIRHPKEKTLLHFLILPRVLGLGLQNNEVAATLRAFPTTIPTLEELTRDNAPLKQQTPIERATKLLEKGYIGKASKALIDPAPLAEETPDMLRILYEKHPIGPKNPFGQATPRPGQPITIEAISSAISSINKEKAPSLSGWTRLLLDIAIASPKSPVLAALRLLTDIIRQGTAPGHNLLCASRLIGLDKRKGGVRPIAIGDFIYRVALKAILTLTYRPNMLLPC
jgi:hypothetical protein